MYSCRFIISNMNLDYSIIGIIGIISTYSIQIISNSQNLKSLKCQKKARICFLHQSFFIKWQIKLY